MKVNDFYLSKITSRFVKREQIDIMSQTITEISHPILSIYMTSISYEANFHPTGYPFCALTTACIARNSKILLNLFSINPQTETTDCVILSGKPLKYPSGGKIAFLSKSRIVNFSPIYLFRS